MSTIENFKSRQLDSKEQLEFAKFAVRGRFNYRPEMPKRFQDLGRVSERLLESRRDADAGNSAWQIYNRIQENMIRGIDGFSRPVKGYFDTIRINQLLWKGAETTLEHESSSLPKAFDQLLIKDGKKGKIAA